MKTQPANTHVLFTRESALPLQLLLSCIALFTAFIYAYIRVGFETDYLQIVKFCGVGLLIANIPMYRGEGGLKFINLPVFIALLAVCIAISYFIKLPFEWLFSIPGFLLFIYHLPAYLGSSLNKSGFILLLFFVVFSIWLGFMFFGSLYATPLFLEETAQGMIHRDQLFHNALCQTLKTYGVASLGIDGPVPLPYHVGSHWLLGRLSVAFNTSVIDAYNLICPLLFIPLYFRIFFIASNAFAQAFLNQFIITDPKKLQGKLFYFCLVLLHLGVLTQPDKNVIYLTNSWLISTSYLCGLLLFYTALIYVSKVELNMRVNDAVRYDLHFIAIFILVLAGLFKISIPMVVLPVWFYFYFRKKWLMQPVIFGMFVLAGAMLLYEMTAFSDGTQVIFDLMSFLKVYIPAGLKVAFYPLYFLVALIAIFLIFASWNVSSFTQIRQLFRERKFITVEILVLMMVIAILPGMVLSVAGGSTNYFADIPRRFSAVILMGLIPVMAELYKRLGFVSLSFVKVISFLLLINSGFLFALNTYRHFRASIQVKIAMRGFSLFGGFRGLQQDFDKMDKYIFLKTLQQINDQEPSVKRKSLAYIPQTDSLFYRSWFPGIGGLSTLMVPAISGIAVLDGMPPADLPPLSDPKLYKRFGSYGFTAYRYRTPQDNPADSTVCQKIGAREMDMSNVYLLNTKSPDSYQLVNCDKE